MTNEECEHLNLSVMKIQEKLKEQNTKLEAEQTAYHREALPAGFSQEISRSVMMDTETVSGELWNKKNVFRESRVLSQI